MDALEFEDKLEPLGMLAGVFLVLGSLASLLGAPWATAVSTPVAIVQLLGIALGLVIGVGLFWLSYEGDRF